MNGNRTSDGKYKYTWNEDDPITMNGYTYADNNPVMMTDPDGHLAWMVLNTGFAAYDGYQAYKKSGWKAAAVAVGVGLVGRAAYKGAKLAYNTFKYGTKLKFTNVTTRKSKPNFQVNISLRQLHNRLDKAGWNQETFYQKGLQIEVALLISEKDIYRDQMIDTTIWQPLSDFLIETEEYHKEIFRDGGKRYRKALVENYAGL